MPRRRYIAAPALGGSPPQVGAGQVGVREIGLVWLCIGQARLASHPSVGPHELLLEVPSDHLDANGLSYRVDLLSDPL